MWSSPRSTTPKVWAAPHQSPPRSPRSLLVVPGVVLARIVGVGAVARRLALVDEVEGDAGNLALGRDLLDAVGDDLAARRLPAHHIDDLVRQTREHACVDHRRYRRAVDHH